MAVPVAQIAHDEKTPILHVPGSVSVGCLALGFGVLAVVTLCRLPRMWNDQRVETVQAAEAMAHGA
jgi:hypothetical protein